MIASSPGQTNDVTDQSDDGNDVDGNVENDSTVTYFDINPSLEVTKTSNVIDTNNNGNNDLGDSIVYTITVQNTEMSFYLTLV